MNQNRDDERSIFRRDLLEMRKKSGRYWIDAACAEQEIELAALGSHATPPGILASFRRFMANDATKIGSRRIVRKDGVKMVPRMDNERYHSRHRDRSWKRNRRHRAREQMFPRIRKEDLMAA